jgi:ABC-type iron transport system FetAB ATPase subunit
MDNTNAHPRFRAEQVGSALLTSTSLSLAKGQCLCISGPSGAGKSLLLRALADLDEHQGTIWLDENESSTLPPVAWRRTVSFMSADSAWWHETVAEHFSADINGMAAKLGFPADVMQWKVDRLSTGEKQRLALLRAMQFKPKVLLLDEPTANMDEENTARVEALVMGYMHDNQASVIWVSHSKAQIERIADQRIVLGGERAACS